MKKGEVVLVLLKYYVISPTEFSVSIERGNTFHYPVGSFPIKFIYWLSGITLCINYSFTISFKSVKII
jgi:hypothetical protein